MISRVRTGSWTFALWAMLLSTALPAALAGTSRAVASGSGARPGPSLVRSVTTGTLARSEFRMDTSEPWRAKVAAWVMETLSRFFKWLSGKAGLNMAESSLLIYALTILAIVGFAIAAWLLLLRLLRGRSAGEGRGSQVENVVSHRRASAPDLAAQAFARADSGDVGEAFRLLYVALLFAMDRLGIINWSRSSTNWDYVRALKSAGRAEFAEDVESLTRVFDLTHYGARTCRMEQFEACKRTYNGLASEQGRAA